MIRKALRRAKPRHRIFVIALLLFVAGLFGAVGVTSAFFQAELDTKTATFAGGYVAVPTMGGTVQPNTSTSSGYDAVFTWTNGTDQTTTDNEVQQVLGADQGATSNCTGASYSTTVTNSLSSPTTTGVSTYVDSNRGSGAINGDWYCYEVVHGWPKTTGTPAWTAAATTNVQIGLAPLSVTINGDGNGKLGNGDSIVITFNQPVSTSIAGASGTCQFATGTAGSDTTYFGDTTCSSTSDSYTVGKLTGVTNNNGTAHAASACAATIGVSGNQVTVTPTCATNGSHGEREGSGGTWTSSSTVKSSAVTDQASACTTGVNCTLSAATGTGSW